MGVNVMVPQPIQRTQDHVYGYEGNQYPGVTTILRVLDKSDGLVPWAARQTADAALRMFSDGSLASMLNAVGNEGAIKALTDRHRWQRDEAAQVGSEVHRLAETRSFEHANDGIAVRARAYADWWQASGWTRPLTEVMGVNPSVGYGGTADLLARDSDGRLVLADIKTGKGVYRESILQLAAYGQFTFIQYPDGDAWKLAVMPTVDRYVILHVTLDGVREVELTIGQDEHMAFADCVDLHRWMGKVKGRL